MAIVICAGVHTDMDLEQCLCAAMTFQVREI